MTSAGSRGGWAGLGWALFPRPFLQEQQFPGKPLPLARKIEPRLRLCVGLPSLQGDPPTPLTSSRQPRLRAAPCDPRWRRLARAVSRVTAAGPQKSVPAGRRPSFRSVFEEEKDLQPGNAERDREHGGGPRRGQPGEALRPARREAVSKGLRPNMATESVSSSEPEYRLPRTAEGEELLSGKKRF
ncbi:hypothetical protein chiPu_0019797 [Chiloscyllium punctatum]|uniref:Uncharacterized protein n=1 Tax=Chiloscyllium punctatum TaxID=137246 RepID=A0A401RT66_CHIPU|nr:hypothetical protein [Chiloscyllium punctatum]